VDRFVAGAEAFNRTGSKWTSRSKRAKNAPIALSVTLTFNGETRTLAGTTEISGKEAAVHWLADWFSRFDPRYTMEVEEARDLGDRVLVVTDHHATGRTSGVPISQTTVQLMVLDAGKITRQEFFASRDEALKAAGLSK